MWKSVQRIFARVGKPAAVAPASPLPLNTKGFSQQKLHDLDDALDRHVWDNRSEILASAECICTACYFRFPASAIRVWQDGRSAVCPNAECGLGGSVIGSASGLAFEDYDYSKGCSPDNP